MSLLNHIPRPPGGWRPVGSRVATVLAGLFALAVLVAPSEPAHLTPAAFLRIPLEGLLGAAVMLTLPERVRRVAAVLAGVGLGRWPRQAARPRLRHGAGPPVRPGHRLAAARQRGRVRGRGVRPHRRRARRDGGGGAGRRRLRDGRCGGAPAQPGGGGPPDRRLARGGGAGRRLGCGRAGGAPGGARRPRGCARAGAVRSTAGQPARSPGVPGSAGARHLRRDPAGGAADRVTWQGRHRRLRGELRTRRGERPRFACEIGGGAGRRRRPPARGRVRRPQRLPHLPDGRVAARWLAHATLLSGLWVDHQQRYRTLVGGDRLTLNRAFSRAGWRTVGGHAGQYPGLAGGRVLRLRPGLRRRTTSATRARASASPPCPTSTPSSAFQRFERSAPTAPR